MRKACDEGVSWLEVGDDSCPFSRRARDGAPPKYARSSSAPARDVRVSHESAPTSGHDPCPKPKPRLLPNPPPNPNLYALTSRRGRKEGARLTMLPAVDHHGQ